MTGILQEFTFVLRGLYRKPAFTLVAVLTLALGIGANMTIFNATNALLLRTMPVSEPDRLVRMYGGSGTGIDIFSYPNYVDVRDSVRTLSGLAAHAQAQVSLGTDRGQPENDIAELVTGNFFSVLNAIPALGRTLAPADDAAPGASPVVVISDGLWRRKFAADPGIIGQKLAINGYPFTIIGVMSAAFTGSQDVVNVNLWVPLMMHEQVRPRGVPLQSRGWGWLHAIGRLRPGVTLEQAQADVNREAARLRRVYPDQDRDLTFRLFKARAVPEEWSEGFSRPLTLLTIVVLLVLLVASANIASLLLTRVIEQRHEIAVRKSLGASPLRQMSRWMLESLVLAILGGVVGLLVAMWGGGILQKSAPGEWSAFLPAFRPDPSVLLFSLLICVLTAIACGVIPAAKLSQIGTMSLLKDKGASQSSRLFGMLIVGQVCFSFLLLLLSALFLRTLSNSESFQPGFNPENLMLARIDLRRNGYQEEAGVEFYRRLLERVHSVPQVQSASLALVVPLGGDEEAQGFRIPGYQGESKDGTITIDNNVVTSGYFSAMGIPLISGRPFDSRDMVPGGKAAVIINETMARRFWPEGNAVGKMIYSSETDAPIEIIGVARDIKYYALGEAPMPYVYQAFGNPYRSEMALQVRTDGDPGVIMRAIQQEAAGLDRTVAVYGGTTFAELRKTQLFPMRALTTLCLFFGGLTLLLTALGIYGTVSYSVQQRVREIGIRMALGAVDRDVLGLFLRRGAFMTVAGLGLGLALALGATHYVASLLFQVSTSDPASFALVSILLAAVVLLACYVPSRRATRINPMEALRYE